LASAAERRTHWLAMKARQQREQKHLAEGKSADHSSVEPVQCSGCSAVGWWGRSNTVVSAVLTTNPYESFNEPTHRDQANQAQRIFSRE